jgi:hypothetical protein
MWMDFAENNLGPGSAFAASPEEFPGEPLPQEIRKSEAPITKVLFMLNLPVQIPQFATRYVQN